MPVTAQSATLYKTLLLSTLVPLNLHACVVTEVRQVLPAGAEPGVGRLGEGGARRAQQQHLQGAAGARRYLAGPARVAAVRAGRQQQGTRHTESRPGYR